MKKISAIILVFALVFCFASCGKSSTGEVSSAAAETEPVINGDETTAVEITEETVIETTTLEETTVEETTEEQVKVPETKEEIIEYYNTAVNKAYDEKVGFSKKRYTDNASFDMSVALRAFKSLVEKFVGIGDENRYTENVTKGQWDSDEMRHYLRKSTLTASDVSSAVVKQNGDNFVIEMSVNSGSSVGNKNEKRTSASIDKCGICVGDKDKNYFDHKTGPVIYDAISGTYAAAKIEESYSNAKVYMTVNSKTGEITNMKIEMDISVFIDIGLGKGSASGKTHIVYSDFKY